MKNDNIEITEKVNLLIVDDHMMVRDGIKTMLLHATKHTAMQVNITEAEDGKQAIDKSARRDFDLILIDFNMPGINGAETVKQILAFKPYTKIIALSNSDELSYIESMIDNGVRGYILKNVDPTELIKAVKTVLHGNNYYSSEVAVKLLEAKQKDKKNNEAGDLQKLYNLSEREMEVLKLIAQAMTNEEIAELFQVTKRTVDSHRQNIMLKTNSKNTASLVRLAYIHKLAD